MCLNISAVSFSQVAGHAQYARNLLYLPGITYDTYKQQCESFRLFLFFGVTGVLALDLLVRPPRSSYWKRWSPIRLTKTLSREFFTYGSHSVLYIDGNHSTEGWETYERVMENNGLLKDGNRKQ